jgi:hypothetical protein
VTANETVSRTGGAPRVALALGLTPSVVALAALLAPTLRVGPLMANGLAFGGATLVPILALAIAATAQVTLTLMLMVALPACAVLVALGWLHLAAVSTMLLVDSALVAVAWAVGTSIGRRVQHPSHLLPACAVAASADIASTLSPEGPTHAIANSDRALSILAEWFPVPGTRALSPALGVGDLLFMALVFGVAARHGLPYARTVLLAALGTAVAGLAAAWLGVAVPALVPIAAAILLGLPVLRRLRPVDRNAGTWSIIIAASVVVAVVVRNSLSR